MARMIDADSLLELFDKYIQFNREENSFVNNFCADVCKVLKDTCVKIMPTVDAVEVVHGRWIYDRGSGNYFCSVCEEYAIFQLIIDWDGTEYYEEHLSNYCPDCGARMDLEE